MSGDTFNRLPPTVSKRLAAQELAEDIALPGNRDERAHVDTLWTGGR